MTRGEGQGIEIFDRPSFGRFNDAVAVAVIDAINVAQGFFVLYSVDELEGSVFPLIPDHDIDKVVFTQDLLWHEGGVISPHCDHALRVELFCNFAHCEGLLDRRRRRLHPEQIDVLICKLSL